jgi:hypothetical protein
VSARTCVAAIADETTTPLTRPSAEENIVRGED